MSNAFASTLPPLSTGLMSFELFFDIFDFFSLFVQRHPFPQALTTLENIISRLRDLDDGRLTPPASPRNSGGSSSSSCGSRQPRSSPASPAPSKKGKRHQSSSPIRQILNSPLLNRRQRKKQQTESSDDENGVGQTLVEETSCSSKHYRDLETFQKAQLRQKVTKESHASMGPDLCVFPFPSLL